MPAGDKEWLLERSNIRQLIRGADDVADDENMPKPVRQVFQDLEAVLQRLAKVLRQQDM